MYIFRCQNLVKAPKLFVSDAFGASLSSREQAEALFQRIKSYTPNVLLDFSGVDFISRSFADQFYKNFIAFDNDIRIEVINGNDVVIHVLNAVTRTQGHVAPVKTSYNIQSFDSNNKLEKYLMSVA